MADATPDLPERIDSEEQLDDLLTRPRGVLVDFVPSCVPRWSFSGPVARWDRRWPCWLAVPRSWPGIRWT